MRQPACLLASLLACCCFPVQAATSLRGMETGEDFRIGPVLTAGMPLGLAEPGDRQLYVVSLQGESPNHGFSRIFLRVVSLYELVNLPKLNDASGGIERQIRFHHQFATLGFESPLYYEVFSPLNLELGWSAGFSLARVTFKDPVKPAGTSVISVFSDYPELKPANLGARLKTNQAQADTQFIGGELGAYLRYYQLYPLVPYASVHANLGSYFNAKAMFEGQVETPKTQPGQTAAPTSSARQRSFESSFSFSPTASIGLDLYLGGRGLLGLDFSFWNWDILNRFQDNTFFLALKAGFLF
ncbi:MAG TPA: hypothetical protein V6D23_26070 [Candidatus Obscuribacterales bacterium]